MRVRERERVRDRVRVRVRVGVRVRVRIRVRVRVRVRVSGDGHERGVATRGARVRGTYGAPAPLPLTRSLTLAIPPLATRHPYATATLNTRHLAQSWARGSARALR